MKRIAVLGVLCIPLALTGCAESATHRPAAPATAQAADSITLPAPDGIVDPLTEITDRGDDRFVADHVRTVLTARGRGTARYEIDPPADVTSLRVYVACAPDSMFQVRAGKGFSGPCSSTFQNFADIPTTGARHVDVGVPASTRFSLLIIATPSN